MFGLTQPKADSLRMIYSSSDYQVEKTLKEILTDCGQTERDYLVAGALVGNVLSHTAYGGRPTQRMWKNLVAAERAYVDAGYEPLTIDDFVDLGGWGNSPGDRFKKAAPVRPAVLPAAQYVEGLKLEEEKGPTFLDRLGSFAKEWYGGE